MALIWRASLPASVCMRSRPYFDWPESPKCCARGERFSFDPCRWPVILDGMSGIFGAKLLSRAWSPLGTIRPWRELPIASWVFCLMGTTTVGLGTAVHVGHYRSSSFTARCCAILVVRRACTLALYEIGRFSSLTERGCCWSRVPGVDSF